MKLTELREALSEFTDRDEWAVAVQAAGATKVVKETGDEPYPVDIHLYAVDSRGGRLWGTWNMKKNVGVVYGGKGLPFDMRRREFETKTFNEGQDFAQHNDLDKKGKPMKLRNVYKEKDIGGKTAVSPQTTIIRDAKTGKIYGRRTLHQK